MKLKDEDKQLLKELCSQFSISFEKMLDLMDIIKEYEFKDRRAGIYHALAQIIKSDLKSNKT